ncbi:MULTISPECIES: DUF6894 family protein [unclassified Methylobacterium]|uniref:DUF6894 family protein n=1 Tax=unclassified Methylobacterium TaxID=2615210 RepID=UPI0037015387
MPLYFFDVHDGVEIMDDVGQSFPDIVAAKLEAMRIAAGFVSRPNHADEGGAVVIAIRDAPDSILATVRLGFVVEC